MAAPLISVVMLVRGERFLASSVDSIRAQTVGDFELIVIDDGSTSGPPGILASYAVLDSRIRAPPGAAWTRTCAERPAAASRAAYLRHGCRRHREPGALRAAGHVPRERACVVCSAPQSSSWTADRPLFQCATRSPTRRFGGSSTLGLRCSPSVMLRRDAGRRRLQPFRRVRQDYDLWLRLSGGARSPTCRRARALSPPPRQRHRETWPRQVLASSPPTLRRPPPFGSTRPASLRT
jgi:glycosyltransferase involved in cell wall biosynthesis